MPSAIETLNEEVQKLGKEMNTIMSDLEPKIQKGIEEAKGVSDLKEQVNKASETVAEITGNMTKLKAEIQERQDQFEIDFKEKMSKQGSAAFKTPGQIMREKNESFIKGYSDEDGNKFDPDPTRSISQLTKQRGSNLYQFKNWGLSYGARQMRYLKTITDAAGSGGPLTTEMRIPGIVIPGQRRLRIRDLVAAGRTTDSVVEFARELTWTDNAQSQALQGDVKGESDATYELVQSTARTIAHFIKISKQMLNDVAQLESVVDGRMMFHLLLEEEDQLLTGDGTGGNLLGIIPQASAYSNALETALSISNINRLDRIRVAITQIQEANHIPDGIAMSVRDWASIELSKTSENAYLFVNPQNQTSPMLWGLPVVATTALSAPQFLVGAFTMGAQIFDKEDASLELSTQDEDNFQRNLCTIRAEERLAFVVYRSDYFVEGNIDGIGSGSGS